jgi:hypothetical protein
MKKTWKRRQFGPDLVATIAASGSDVEAAARLGVDTSTLRRWRQAGHLPPRARREPRQAADVPTLEGPVTPAAWAADVRARYALTASESALVDLAVAALRLAHDAEARPADRLGAMGRFQALLKQLALEDPADGQAETTPTRPRLVVG